MVESAAGKSSDYHRSGEKLCFEPNEFLKVNFSVDEFLHRNRNAPSLEVLRDDLGLYLKKLRASMIDLINEDYADFVSLSGNLLGLDHTINNIRKPLDEMHDEILTIKTIMDLNIREISGKLASKHKLRQLKRRLLCLKKVFESRLKLEYLMQEHFYDDCEVKTIDLERAALELIQLKVNQKFCAEYLVGEQEKAIEVLEAKLHEKLRMLFNDCLHRATSTSSEPLERCLRIYISLDACMIAEKAFREDVVAPFMSDIICEYTLQKTPQGLAGVYSKILNFISLHMTDLLRLTQYSDKIQGFNFLIESFWLEVVTRLETNLSSIFAPGNSEVFYIKYKCTQDFMMKMEELLANSEAVAKFRQHPRTIAFLNRWNLPVYFQICFQEIAGDFEAIMDPILTEDSLNAKSDQINYKLKPFTRANQAILRCWSEGIYLPEIFTRFYKLHLQIVARIKRWLDDVLSLVENSTGNTCTASKLNGINLLVSLYADLTRFTDSFEDHMKQLVLQNIPRHINEFQINVMNDAISKAFTELKISLDTRLVTIEGMVVDRLLTECGPENLRQVSDLPRLYRKTNREIPTRCSVYVDQVLKPLKEFYANETFATELGADIIKTVISRVLRKILKEYFVAVNEVLVSVQKTEESLRRLKNLKGTNSTFLVNTPPTSDDDKIRLQLRLDVLTWSEELVKLGLNLEDFQLTDLCQVIDNSIKNK